MLGEVPLSGGVFVAVDIETTGCVPGRNGVMEIGAVRLERGRVTARFERLLDPGEPVPYPIEMLTGISDRMVSGLPGLPDAMPAFREFVDGAVLIAHNHRFDLGFLDYAAELLWGKPFLRPVLDTLVISKRLDPEMERHNLAALGAQYGTVSRPSHRALADAETTAEVFLKMVPRLMDAGLQTAADAAAFCGMEAQSVLSEKLPLTTELPDKPGVYLFRDEDDNVIYVGIANSLRTRVRNYFYAWGASRKPRIAREARSVEYVECMSALEAMLLETSLIREHRPSHNGRAAAAGKVALAVDVESEFPSLKLTSRPGRRNTVIGPFTNRTQMQRVVDLLRDSYDLKRCSRQLTPAAAARDCPLREVVGACPQPCLGTADVLEYGQRLEQAMSVFNGSFETFRRQLTARIEAARKKADGADLMRCRDALRALERSIASLTMVREEFGRPGVVLVEPAGDYVALHLVRHGYHVRTLHLERSDVRGPKTGKRVRQALKESYFDGETESDAMELTADQLQEIFTIHTFRARSTPLEVQVTDDLDQTLEAVLSALPERRGARNPSPA